MDIIYELLKIEEFKNFPMFNMQSKIYLLLGQCICFCNIFTFSSSKALVGTNVRYAAEDEFPFVVSLSIPNPINTCVHKHFCTGSLVSNRDVLTAEHCVRNRLLSRVRIIVGSSDLRRCQKFNPLWWLTYEEWCLINEYKLDYSENDIAIIRLHGNVTSNIEPARLSDMRNHHMVGRDVEIAGWGKKEDNTNPMFLEVAEVTVIDLYECISRVSQAARERHFIEPVFFCTRVKPYTLVQNGDNGGPVVYMNEIVGVTQGTRPFPDIAIHPDKINVHTGIFHFRIFIYDVIQCY